MTTSFSLRRHCDDCNEVPSLIVAARQALRLNAGTSALERSKKENKLPSPPYRYPKIEKFKLRVEIPNFWENGWRKRVAPALKVVHLADEIQRQGSPGASFPYLQPLRGRTSKTGRIGFFYKS